MKIKPLLNILALVLIVVYLSFKKIDNDERRVIEMTTIDTLLICNTDTIVRYEPKYITKRVVDTLYITDTIFLPIVQKHYSERGLYDVWVSGCEAKMDSIRTYNKTEYKYIEKEVTREVIKNKHELYFNGGLNAFSGIFIPKVGVSLITPKKTHYNANVGFYNGKITYEIGVGFKLF